ncbi:MAG TPA: septation protein A [Rhizomicrobium sp.]|nr:septation protein A [Rhizomicrobium sp.]
MNPQIRRLLLDLGPLFLFFLSFEFRGIFVATGIFMLAVLVALAVGWHLEKRLSPIPLITAVLVMIFGGLTLYLKNDVFIKMKPTVLYTIFGATLLGGLLFNRLFIKYVFTEAFDLTERGWRGLTWRWGVFFLILAAINEAVWRNTSTATWVSFKVWGIMSLIFIFALAQTPFLLKHHVNPES